MKRFWILGLAAFVFVGCGDDDRTMGTDTGGSDATTGVDTGTPPMSPLVDPNCVDGMYTETLPNASAPLDDITFTSAPAYYDEILSRRYPTGAHVVEGGRMNPRFGDCSELFSGGASTPEQAMQRLGVVVHECGHFMDLNLSSGPSSVYVLTDSLTKMCDRGDTTSRGGDTFARSRLNGDSYSSMRPPCNMMRDPGCDSYADIYLDGDPDNAEFEGGDQGFNLLFEETVQYVNSLATAYAFLDQEPPGRRTSARDGILTFLWYVERYLRMARLEYPMAYQRIADDPCWRDVILTVWGRAWLFLELTNDMPALSINGEALEALVMDAELLGEIQRLRDLQGC